jgi:hypothetical protein
MPNLSQSQVQEITSLREMRGLSYRQLANRFACSESTIYYHCLYAGADKPGRPLVTCSVKPGAVEMRKNGIVRRYSEQEDAIMSRMRLDGCGFTEIARAIGVELGFKRKGHSIRARLAALARRQARMEWSDDE